MVSPIKKKPERMFPGCLWLKQLHLEAGPFKSSAICTAWLVHGQAGQRRSQGRGQGCLRESEP